jgi:hypothetical protein
MKLPNAKKAVIEREKVVAYLLNPLHPDAIGKAKFFLALGFRPGEWQTFAEALRELARVSPVADKMVTGHGTKYTIIGALRTPCGEQPAVKTVWIVDRGATVPRLVTAYPYEE